MQQRTPPPHDPGTCADCFFSQQDADGNWRCHHQPPPTTQGMAAWPVVQADDWCACGYYNGSYYTPDGAKP